LKSKSTQRISFVFSRPLCLSPLLSLSHSFMFV
jgi:hypothetical protein